MRILTLAVLVVAATTFGLSATAQQSNPGQNLQSEADKGAKTQNSGASGYVGDQERPGAAVHPPGEPGTTTGASSTTTTAPSAQNSGTGISGSPGNKNGPAVQKGTVGSSQPNLSVQEQDPSNVKGLPGGKSGAATKQSPH